MTNSKSPPAVPVASPKPGPSDRHNGTVDGRTTDPGNPFKDEHGRIVLKDAEQQRAYAGWVRDRLDEIAQIGTPEERAEDLDFLMKALAETRREEGRVF